MVRTNASISKTTTRYLNGSPMMKNNIILNKFPSLKRSSGRKRNVLWLSTQDNPKRFSKLRSERK